MKLSYFVVEEFRAMYFLNPFSYNKPTVLDWSEYLQLGSELLGVTAPKATLGGCVFGINPNLGRKRSDFEQDGKITALVVDIDTSLFEEKQILDLIDSFKTLGLTFHAQWRQAGSEWKAHFIFPFSTAVKVTNPMVTHAFNKHLTALLFKNDVVVDRTVGRPEGLLYYVHKRENQPIAKELVHQTKEAIDGTALYKDWCVENDIRPALPIKRIKPNTTDYTQDKISKRAEVILKHVTVHGWVESKGGWQIHCPLNHEDAKKNKTLLYPNGLIVCLADKCIHQHFTHFLAHLPEEVENVFKDITVSLPAATEKVSVDQAHERIEQLFKQIKPVNLSAACAKITTGAGKTHAVTNYLMDYSAPFSDEEPGLTSVLGTPTNALLQEIEPKIAKIPYTKRVGVLAVLNDDGTPACNKYEEAKKLQTAGGNVHKLMCSHCEFKNDCAARAATIVGSGSLNITNHALLPSVADKLRAKHRYPLVVWDESPAWTQAEQIPLSELNWLLQQFDLEALPPAQMSLLHNVSRVQLYSVRYRKVVKPLIDFIRASINLGSLIENQPMKVDKLFQRHYRFLKSQIDVKTAASIATPTANEPNGWDLMRNAFLTGNMLSRVESGYDKMHLGNKERVVRTEKLIKFLTVMCGSRSALAFDGTDLFTTSLSESADMFIEHGGIILDATANLQVIKSLRPDTVIEDIKVIDADNENTRVFIEAPKLSRTALKFDKQILDVALRQIHKDVKRWDVNQTAKVALFTHKPMIDYCKKHSKLDVTTLHYGNTRGYDLFFQGGYNVFITLGDPITNLSALMMQWFVLHGYLPEQDSEEWDEFVSYTAQAELAQAHGRARDPQITKNKSGRLLHIHFGRKIPDGWDASNTKLDFLNST